MERLKAAKAEADGSVPDTAGPAAEAETQRKLNLAAAQRFIKAGLGGETVPPTDLWADEDKDGGAAAAAAGRSSSSANRKKRKAEGDGPASSKEKAKKEKKSKKSKKKSKKSSKE